MSFDAQLALVTVQLSRIAYRELDLAERDIEGFALANYRKFSQQSTQAFVAEDAELRYLAFRGTESTNHVDWLKDAKFRPVPGVWGTQVHRGFREALDEVWDEVLAVVGVDDRRLVITGHSLGAGLATLAAARLVAAGHGVDSVYTYGSPRVGLRDFAAAYEAALGAKTYRVINHIDIVTRVPLLILRYRHVGKRMYFDANERFHPDASGWHIARDDLAARLRHWGRIESSGVAPHAIPFYVDRIESIQ